MSYFIFLRISGARVKLAKGIEPVKPNWTRKDAEGRRRTQKDADKPKKTYDRFAKGRGDREGAKDARKNEERRENIKSATAFASYGASKGSLII